MPVRIVRPVPFCVSAPAPLINPDRVVVPDCNVVTKPPSLTVLANVLVPERFKARVEFAATLTALILLIEPLVPLPICKVPLETVVAPL